jgi:hypothetical protein
MTCKRHCINVQAYLLDVLRRIRTASPAELESLLPSARSLDPGPSRSPGHAADPGIPRRLTRKRQRRAQRRRAVPSR